MVFLALDIGNSAVKGGIFRDGTIERIFHVDVAVAEPSSEAAVWTRALREHVSDVAVDRVGVASVVPEAAPVAEAALRELTGAEVGTVDTEADLPFRLAYETPQTLGADRLAAAAAAWVLHGRNGEAGTDRSVVAIDAGTAVTYEVVSRDGVYRGGAIAAGPVLMQRALRTGTAQLPTVPLVFPGDVVGRSTREAMQSGVMWGFVDSVRGMIGRIHTTLDDDPAVIVTGGWGEVLAHHLDDVDHVIPHLVLEGVRLLVGENHAGR
jgi:type III pantothenate kinase